MPDAARRTVSVVIPTLDGGRDALRLWQHLQAQLSRGRLHEVLVIDSGSRDGTVEAAESAGLRVHRLANGEFGHGRTRQLGVTMTTGEVIAFLTQDVLPVTPDWPARFAAAFADPAIAGVYGRQVPRDATTMEMFFVALNYPATPLRFDPRPGGHAPRPGRVLFSNAFSAVRRTVIEHVPFPAHADFSEDQLWAHAALAAGHSIAYVPGAEALHAHRYTLDGLFQRSASIGRALSRQGLAGGANFRESLRFLTNEVRYFVHQGHVHRLPQLLSYEFLRWAGFQWGRRMGARMVARG